MPLKSVQILQNELRELEKKKEELSNDKKSKEYIYIRSKASNVRQTIEKRKHIEKCKDTYRMNNDELVSKLKTSLMQYYMKGNRSSEKIKHIHFYINCLIRFKLHKKLDSRTMDKIEIMSEPHGETQASGYINKKNIDISVKFKNKVIGIVSVKFFMSNYSQNAYNYMENMLGETINLKHMHPDRVFWFIIFSFDDIPYYTNNNELDVKKKSKLNPDKYLKINNDKLQVFPDYISITLINNRLEKMIHPNKVQDKSETHVMLLVENIFDSEKLLYAKHMNFFHTLDRFVTDIVNVVSRLQSRSQSSSKDSTLQS